MIPVAPLWGFFTHIRERSPVLLSIDQYFYLVHAIHRMDMSHLETTEDLMRFTKLFWLNDPRFEKQYETAFKAFLDWNTVLKQNAEPGKGSTTAPKPIVDTPPEVNQETQVDPQKEKSEEKPPTPVMVEPAADVDFQLIVKETQSSTGIEEPSMNWLIKHDFALSDMAIVPFDGRHFVQRLRRKVETTEQIYSDVLDLPLIVNRYAETGFIDDIIYETQDTRQSNVVLLADRYGSMLAHEYLEQHFDQSLRQIPYCQYEHYYFYNLPKEAPEGTHYELQPAKKGADYFYTAKHKWNKNTWFLILSDAGAHSGFVNRERMKHTMTFWKYLQSISGHVFWINPVHNDYMDDGTASRLQMSIPMIYPDQPSLNTLIFERNPLTV